MNKTFISTRVPAGLQTSSGSPFNGERIRHLLNLLVVGEQHVRGLVGVQAAQPLIAQGRDSRVLIGPLLAHGTVLLLELQDPVLGIGSLVGSGLSSSVEAAAGASHDFDEIVVAPLALQFLQNKAK